jgi:uncharacterized protein YbjT (DUF2867 family)
MSGLVFVAGAAGGGQGATGRQVAERLLERGAAVRAFVRSDDKRAERLRGLGAEVVVGDLRDIAHVEQALKGVDRVFFTYPVTDGLLDASAAVAAAAREHGVRRVVEVSQLSPRPHAHSPRTRQHWLSEQVFDWADIGAVHLRATVFYENIGVLATAGLARPGELAMPLGAGTTTIPLVGTADLVRVAVALLDQTAPPAEPYYRFVGATPTITELVEEMGAALGIPLRYVEIDAQTWREEALANGFDAHAVEHLSRLWDLFSSRTLRAGLDTEVTDSVDRVTGGSAQTLAEFFAANRADLLGRLGRRS